MEESVFYHLSPCRFMTDWCCMEALWIGEHHFSVFSVAYCYCTCYHIGLHHHVTTKYYIQHFCVYSVNAIIIVGEYELALCLHETKQPVWTNNIDIVAANVIPCTVKLM